MLETLLKFLWELDRFYFTVMIIFIILAIIDLFKFDVTAYSIDLLFIYISLNELRYKYDNKNLK